MDADIDFNAMKKRYELQGQLREQGKCCPMCSCYKLYENPGRGKAHGFCTRIKEEHPDKPIWWGKARKDVCYRFEERRDDET